MCCRAVTRGVTDPWKSHCIRTSNHVLSMWFTRNHAQERTRNENSIESRSNEKTISYKYKAIDSQASFTIEYLRTNEPIRGWSKGSRSQWASNKAGRK